MSLRELAEKKCAALSGAQHQLDASRVNALLADLPGWELIDGQISKNFTFRNYDETMTFVNGVAWLSQRENHHPDLTVGYNRCRVAYSTHDVGGLSRNDFICAAKLDALFSL